MRRHREVASRGVTGSNRLRLHLPHLPLRIPQRRLLLAGVDLIILNGVLLLRLHVELDTPLSVATIMVHPLSFVALTVLWLLIASCGDSYDLKRAAQASTSTFGVVRSLILVWPIHAFLPFLPPPYLTNRLAILLLGALAAGSLAAWRIAYATVLAQPNFQCRALIAGAGWAGRTLAQAVRERDTTYRIVGYIDDDQAKQGQAIEGIPVLGTWRDMTTVAQAHAVSHIVLAITHHMHGDLVRAVLKCREQGLCVVPMPELFGQITGRIPVEHIGDHWLVYLPLGQDSRGLYPIVKRVMDIAIAGIGLLMLAPFFPFLALAIKLDSPGPIFYRPERMGRGGKPFRLWKFRTMVSNADRIGDPTFTGRNDDRVTRIGRILRASHIDEFPQFINVLRGEMSAVGPRPERYVPELEEVIPFYRLRLAIRPGMAGWGLVNQGYAEGTEDTLVKLQYDLYYIRHQSLAFDILILAKTAMDMVVRRGR